MSLIIICDRCRNEIKDKDKVWHIDAQYTVGRACDSDMKPGRFTYRDLDICPECMDRINNFITAAHHDGDAPLTGEAPAEKPKRKYTRHTVKAQAEAAGDDATPPMETGRIMQMYNDGSSSEEIAEATGIAMETVGEIILEEKKKKKQRAVAVPKYKWTAQS
jgi:hypothetical protein